jgi:Uma2 family endonuclease
MNAVAERLTADEYLARDDQRRTELLEGVVVVNEPSVLHQLVCEEIHAQLRAWIRAGGHGQATWPLDVVLDDRNVPAPDVLWFAEPIPRDSPRAPRVPEIAVEVRSPSTWGYDIGPKRELYERHGVRELWLADTASRTLLVYSRTQGGAGFDRVTELGAGDSLTSPLLPGFKLAIDSVFPAS